MMAYYWLDYCDHISVKFSENLTILIEGYAFENIVCKMVAILFRYQCVKLKEMS